MLGRAIVLGLAVASLLGRVASGQEASPGGKWGGPIAGPHAYREIQIESDPPGAVVWIDGRRFGTTPQAIRVDNDHRTIQVILSKPGYLDTVEELDLTNLTKPVAVIYMRTSKRTSSLRY